MSKKEQKMSQKEPKKQKISIKEQVSTNEQKRANISIKEQK